MALPGLAGRVNKTPTIRKKSREPSKYLLSPLYVEIVQTSMYFHSTAANWCHKVNQYLRFKNQIENKSCSGPQSFS